MLFCEHARKNETTLHSNLTMPVHHFDGINELTDQIKGSFRKTSAFQFASSFYVICHDRHEIQHLSPWLHEKLRGKDQPVRRIFIKIWRQRSGNQIFFIILLQMCPFHNVNLFFLPCSYYVLFLIPKLWRKFTNQTLRALRVSTLQFSLTCAPRRQAPQLMVILKERFERRSSRMCRFFSYLRFL